MGILLGEQPRRALGEVEKARAFFEVILIRRLMQRDLTQASFLLRAHVAGQLLEKVKVDPPVQLVDVDGVDAVLEAFVFALKPGNGGFVLLLLVGMALAQGRAEPCQHLIAETQPIQHRFEALLQRLLPHIGLAAFPLEAGAMVIDVAALLDLADQRAAAMAALDQALKRKIVGAAPRLAGVASVENALHALPQLARHQRLVPPLAQATVPQEFAGVESVA